MITASPDYSPQGYAAQLEHKLNAVTALFAGSGAPAAEVFPSAPAHYRQRAEFRVWLDGDNLHYLMFARGNSSESVRIDCFPPASLRINEVMHDLRCALRNMPELRRRLFQVEFLATLDGETLLTLIYHRRLDALWEESARSLQSLLGVRIVGRSRGQRVVLDQDWITERLAVGDLVLEYRQPEGCFTQPNAGVNRAMLGWAKDSCSADAGDLLELYCGIGNFTVALAPHFRRVLATEIGSSAIAAARHNLEANGISNTFLARLSSAEAAAAIAGERPFRRLAGFDLEGFEPATLLVDPPRAGLDAATLEFARRFARIVYISCNPGTLHANLNALGNAYRIERFALFDQFPYTEHMECGVLLHRHGA
jgi:tRNA (uracil-5-)-methyltransferase